MPQLAHHPEANIIRVQLRQNLALRALTAVQWEELEPLLDIVDYPKGELLEHQGAGSMEQYFILDGILKRVVANSEGREIIPKLASNSSTDAAGLDAISKGAYVFSIRAVTRVRAAKLSMEDWVEFMNRHPAVKADFEFHVMKLMSEVMAHVITLHLLDAPGRVQRFLRKQVQLGERLPKKELACYLNLSPETLSRLKKRGKIKVP